MKFHLFDSTKKKLFIASAAAVMIPVLIIISIVNYQVTKIAETTYLAGMKGEISRVDDTITMMFEGADSAINIIGNTPATKHDDPSFNRYTDRDSATLNKDVKRSASEKMLHAHLSLVQESDPDYDGAIYASRFGAYIVADPEATIPARFNPRTRPYFNLAMNKPGSLIQSKVYRGLKGTNVVVAAKAFKDSTGDYSYIAGVAISLSALSDKIGAIKIGESGYIVLTDADGTIVAHPKRKDLVGKNVSELKIPAITELIKAGTGTIRYAFDNADKMGVVITGKNTGWRLMGIVSQDEVLAGGRMLRSVIIIIGIIFAAIAIVGGYYIARKISDPIASVIAALNETAKGDFTHFIDKEYERRHDEIGSLALSFNSFIVKMSEMIQELKMTFVQLAEAADQIAQAISSFNSNIQAESANSEEITASSEEISAGMENVANSAERQNETMSSLSSQIKGLATHINEINDLIRKTGSFTSEMSSDAKNGESSLRSMQDSMMKIIQSSRDMASILKIINDISDQINLLSLNASIEAARAGEAGRGFAVVADEVSHLADQTAASLKDIGNLISINNQEIANGQSGVDGSISLITKIMGQVQQIAGITSEMQTIMDSQLHQKEKVENDASRVKELSEQIAHATGENKIGIIEITKSVTEISQLSQSNAASAEEIASSAEQLAGMADNLKARMDIFKV